MRILINVCTRQKGIIFFNQDEILYREVWDAKGQESAHVLPSLMRGSEKTGGTVEGLDEIIVVTGPGSFTGIRVAVSVVNTLGHLYPGIVVKTLTVGEYFSALHPGVELGFLFQVYASDAFEFDHQGQFVGRIPKEEFGELMGKTWYGEVMKESEFDVTQVLVMDKLTLEHCLRIGERSTKTPVPVIPFYGKGANITIPKKA